jgi:hypothetical protein
MAVGANTATSVADGSGRPTGHGAASVVCKLGLLAEHLISLLKSRWTPKRRFPLASSGSWRMGAA